MIIASSTIKQESLAKATFTTDTENIKLFNLNKLRHRKQRYIIYPPAFSGLGTPPTKTVFLGSKGNEASNTKSASDSLQGLICTGLSLIVGDDTHRYNLSSSAIH